MKNGSMAFFCKWVLDNTFFGSPDAWGASQSLLAVMGAIPMAIAAAFVVPLANKFGKQKLVLLGMVVGAIGGVIAGHQMFGFCSCVLSDSCNAGGCD